MILKFPVVFLASVGIINSLLIQATHITLNNGGYEGIVVAFATDINEAEGEPLIPKIKELFTQGSRALYTATRQRSYFKEVTILVPQSWTSKSNYLEATFETFTDADIRIDSPNPTYGDGPYALQYLPCGYPGEFIHLTPNYLKYLLDNSTKNFGHPGKTLVHEWAHLRYGIFDEFGLFNDPNFPIFYLDYTADEVLPNACANKKLVGKSWNPIKDVECTYEETLQNQDCIFIPDVGANDATSSIASYHFLPDVDTFCDDTADHKHNRRAPNKHNALCNSRSTWSVITDHDDFKGNRNPPNQVSNLVPNFKIVQQKEATFSLVLDISSSMNGERIKMLQDVVTRWIREEVKLGSAVGIITFSTATVHQGTMKMIDNDSIRNVLIAEIPQSVGGWTCIGCGLISGKEQLSAYRKSLGGTIILLTDGEENKHPYIQDVQQDLINAKIRVVTIAFTEMASNHIEQLAAATGGKAYFVPLSAGVQGLGSAFFDALTVQSLDADIQVKISDEIFNTPGVNLYQGAFSIDSSLGNDTVVSFIYKQENDITNIRVHGPNIDASMNDPSVTIDRTVKTIQFRFPTLKPGKYSYTINRNGASNQEIVVTVTSKAFANGAKPITTKCWTHLERINGNPVLVIFAEVKQGNNPVINADVMVQIERPNNKKAVVEPLYDNGGGAPDITANDGIYSRYFTKFSGKGRYSVKAQIAGSGKTSVQEMGFIASQSMPVVNKYVASLKATTKPTGEFERSSSGGAVNLDENVNAETADIFPPSKIQNLGVLNISSYDGEFIVTLTWTAPGDDLDSGTVSCYAIRYSKDWDSLFDHFAGSGAPFDKSPAPSGSNEYVEVTLLGAKPQETYFFSVRAYDKVNQTSPTSNIAQVTIPLPPTTTPMPTTTQKPPKKGWLQAILDEIYRILGSIFGNIRIR